MAGAIRKARVLRADGEEVLDVVATEDPLEIVLRYPEARGGRIVDFPLSVTMRTPGNDEELVCGLLFCEGLIEDAAAIDSFEREDARLTVRLTQPPRERPERRERTFLSASSCGVCGKSELSTLPRLAAPAFSPTVPVLAREVLSRLPDLLRETQEAFASSGGCHAAGRFTMDGSCQGVYEDVGRHNALDKLIGRALLDGELPALDEVLLVSGRVSYELVQKSLAAGFPILAAIGAPSSLAVELSNTARQTLVGFLRADRYNLYSHPQRIAPS